MSRFLDELAKIRRSLYDNGPFPFLEYVVRGDQAAPFGRGDNMVAATFLGSNIFGNNLAARSAFGRGEECDAGGRLSGAEPGDLSQWLKSRFEADPTNEDVYLADYLAAFPAVAGKLGSTPPRRSSTPKSLAAGCSGTTASQTQWAVSFYHFPTPN